VNSDDERKVLLNFRELTRRFGPSGFMVLAHLRATADRVNGQLVANTTCRETADAVGLSRSTVGRIFNDLCVQRIIEGSVSSRGSRFVVPESVLGLIPDDLPVADRIS
jgi:hypothetical protein